MRPGFSGFSPLGETRRLVWEGLELDIFSLSGPLGSGKTSGSETVLRTALVKNKLFWVYIQMATFPSPRELFSIFVMNLVGFLERTLMMGWGSPSDWPPRRISNSQTPTSHSVGFSTLVLFPGGLFSLDILCMCLSVTSILGAALGPMTSVRWDRRVAGVFCFCFCFSRVHRKDSFRTHWTGDWKPPAIT